MNSYFDNYNKLISKDHLKNLNKIYKKIIQTSKKNRTLFIYGNGGSAAVSSHFTVDYIKNFKSKCINFSDNSLITCFANDYGYDKSLSNLLNIFATKGDTVLFISSSGNSKNIINAVKLCRSKNIYTIGFTGFEKNNYVSKNVNISVWVDSKQYNYVENTHQILILSLIDKYIYAK